MCHAYEIFKKEILSTKGNLYGNNIKMYVLTYGIELFYHKTYFSVIRQKIQLIEMNKANIYFKVHILFFHII